MIIEPVWILGVDHQFQMLFQVGLKFKFIFFILPREKNSMFFMYVYKWGTNYCLWVETLKINFPSWNVFFILKDYSFYFSPNFFLNFSKPILQSHHHGRLFNLKSTWNRKICSTSRGWVPMEALFPIFGSPWTWYECGRYRYTYS